MRKTRSYLLKALLPLAALALLSGCSFLRDQIRAYSSDKVECALNAADVTQFAYKEDQYVILEETQPAEERGEWVGFIRRLAAVDETGAILAQRPIEELTFEALAELADSASGTVSLLSFTNVYTALRDDACLLVEVGGEYHRAIAASAFTAADRRLDVKAPKASAFGTVELSAGNATQLVCGGAVYQVTDKAVSCENLGRMLAVIARQVTFDADTQKPLSQKELNKIDWLGRNAQRRECWSYGDVYALSGAAPAEVVAVEVNGRYYEARRQ